MDENENILEKNGVKFNQYPKPTKCSLEFQEACRRGCFGIELMSYQISRDKEFSGESKLSAAIKRAKF